jgi:hypothetical protein
LEEDVFPLGSRVCVVIDSSLKGCKGTILAIQMTATPGEPTNRLYLVALDGTHLLEPRWFESHEVALVETACEKPVECSHEEEK